MPIFIGDPYNGTGMRWHNNSANWSAGDGPAEVIALYLIQSPNPVALLIRVSFFAGRVYEE
jgi:hypothetical protein